MSDLTPYLTFDGTCAKAMRAYESILGGRIDMMMTHAQSPMAAQTPPEMAERIMHCRMTLPDGRALLASDAPLGGPSQGMHGITLSLTYPSVDEARRVFDALADGGTVSMPLAPTFWTDAFGMVTDRFGVPWMINGPMKPMA